MTTSYSIRKHFAVKSSREFYVYGSVHMPDINKEQLKKVCCVIVCVNAIIKRSSYLVCF